MKQSDWRRAHTCSPNDGPVVGLGLIVARFCTYICSTRLFVALSTHTHTVPFNVRPVQVASATIPPSDSVRKYPSSSAHATRATDTRHIRPSLAHAPAAATIGDQHAASALPAALTGTSTGGGSTTTKPTATDEQYELADYSHIRARQEPREEEARRATKYTAKLAELEGAFEMK
jgi:hypothetical protein